MTHVPEASAPTAVGERDGARRYLEALCRAAATFEAQELSEWTKTLYRRDWDQFAGWCTQRDLVPLPATVDTVRLFVADMARKWRTGDGTVLDAPADSTGEDLPEGAWVYKPATIERRLAAVAWVHKTAQHPSPTQDSRVRAQLTGVRRLRQARPRRMRPLVTDDIRTILSRMDYGTFPAGVKAHRDALVLLLGFAAGRRRSEIAALTLPEVTPDPRIGLLVHIRRSKTDQLGEGFTAVVPFGNDPLTCGPCLRWRWLRLLATAGDRAGTIRTLTSTGGPETWQHVCARPDPDLGDWGKVLFPRMRRGGALLPEPISGDAVFAIVKARAAAAGYHGRYGAHSLRAGFVTAARRAGADARAIRLQTGHGSDSAMLVYDREYNPDLGNAVHQVGL